MKNKNFENATRSSAIEIIATIAEEMPSLLRKQQNELKTQFFPALAVMLTQFDNEDNLEEWALQQEEEILARNDP